MAWLDDNPNHTLRQQRSPRREAVSGVFVVHTAENTPDFVAFDGGAEAVARYIGTRDTYGSYHLLSDSDSIIRMVEWANEAFHDATSGGNRHEIGGSIATRADVWDLAPKAWRDGAIDNLARGFAEAGRWVKATRGIVVPARRITRAQSEDRVPGFISHGARDPGRRSDPGWDNRPHLWDQFFDRYSHHGADFLGTRPTPKPTPAIDPDEEALMALSKETKAEIREIVAEAIKANNATLLMPLIGAGADDATESRKGGLESRVGSAIGWAKAHAIKAGVTPEQAKAQDPTHRK